MIERIVPTLHANRGFFGASHRRAGKMERGARLLRPGTVFVWWLRTDRVSPADCHRWLRILDREERERSERFRFERDRREFIAAHALLRSMLTFHLGRPTASWQFTTGAFGKPKFAEKFRMPDIDFNLSHTRDLVAAAVVARGAVGVDVEKIDLAKADLDVAQHYFAAAEVEILRQTPPPERATCFFRLWTLKEAYLKAIGAGLGTPLDSFAFTLAPIRINFLAASRDHLQRWHFAMLPTTGRHILSLAVTGHGSGTVRVLPRAVGARDL
jgi:4'-phosphopantetheinyl transferase